jgi:hypothetical protein
MDDGLFNMDLVKKDTAGVTNGVITYYGDVSPSFIEATQSGWNQNTPWTVKELLKASNYEIYAGRLMSDIPMHDAPFSLAEGLPKDVFGRNLQNHFFAKYWSFFNKATIAENFVPPSVTDIAQQGGASSIIGSLPDGGAEAVQNDVSKYSVLHESSHGVDNVVKKITGWSVSESDAFLTAYGQDLKNLGGFEGASEKGYLYYANAENPALGIQELFADLSAHKHAGAMDSQFYNDFKNSGEYVSEFYNNLDDAYKADYKTLISEDRAYKFDLAHPNIKNFFNNIHNPTASSDSGLSLKTSTAENLVKDGAQNVEKNASALTKDSSFITSTLTKFGVEDSSALGTLNGIDQAKKRIPSLKTEAVLPEEASAGITLPSSVKKSPGQILPNTTLHTTLHL